MTDASSNYPPATAGAAPIAGPPADLPVSPPASEQPAAQAAPTDASTVAPLEAPEPASPPDGADRPRLVLGDCGEFTLAAARLLAAAGYDNPVASGAARPVYDDGLAQLVSMFQRAVGINPTGGCDAPTWAALDVAADTHKERTQ